MPRFKRFGVNPKQFSLLNGHGNLHRIPRWFLFILLAACPGGSKGCSNTVEPLDEFIPAQRVDWYCPGCESSTIRSYVGDVIEPFFQVIREDIIASNAEWSVSSTDPSVVEAITSTSANNIPGASFKSLKKGTANITARLESHTVGGETFEWKRTVIVTDPPTTLVVTPETKTLLVGQQFELKAEGRTANGELVTHIPVNWKATTHCDVVTPLLCGASGSFANPVTIKASKLGEIDVTGTFTVKPNGQTLQKTVRVHVVQSLAPYVVITVPETGPMAVGSTRHYVAVVHEANGKIMEGGSVSWSITSPSPAGVATVSAQGVVTCHFGGTAKVRATMNGGTAFAEEDVVCSVPVATTVVVGQIGFGGNDPLQVGLPRSFAATVRDQFGQSMSSVPVTWSIVSGPATVLPSTPTTLASVLCSNVGTGVVRASVNAFVFGEASFTCNPGPAPEVMEIDPVDASALVGQNVTFRVRLVNQFGFPTVAAPGHRVVYTIENSAVAENTGGDVTSGVITAKASGTTLIHAQHVPIAGGTPTLTATATLRVGSNAPGNVAGVRISTNGQAMHMLVSPGLSQGALATAFDAAGNVVNGVNFRWTSSNPTSVSVNANTGTITALSAGGAIVYAKAILPNNEDGPAGTFFVTVRPRGAIEALVQAQAGPGTVPATGATLRAYQSNELKATVSVSGNSHQPGRVYMPGLQPGTYTVTVSLPGFATRTFENVVVTAETITALNNNTAIVLQGTN